ncbi:MAG TPA: aminotransferase class IV [Phycisphaerales bacterium]|nr:aminotransferase class IV [Phycisphaerales bacterium]
MAETFWLNGKFVARDEARVSAFDAAVQHGVGLFETMIASEGRVFRVEKHLSRLAESAKRLGLSDSLRAPRLAEAVETVVERSELASGEGRARVRLTVTGGDLNLLSSTGRGAVDPTVFIAVTPATRYPPEMFERGVAAVIADLRVNPLDPFAGHKTLNYWPRLHELQVASSKGAAEAIFFQVTNHVAGGAVSNLFAVKNGEVSTPVARGEEARGAIASPVLPGVTRGFVIEEMERRRTQVRKRMLSIDDVLEADEVFLTNSSWGVLPIVKIESKEIGAGGGEPGELSRELRAAWVKAVEEEP